MTAPVSTECSLAQDLLIPCAAGEVRPETKDWLNAHLSRCPSCRQAHAQLGGDLGQLPAPPPPADPGRRLMGRMRRTVLLIIGVVVLLLGVTGGSIFFGVRAILSTAGMDVQHIVPADRYTAVEAARAVDLASLGLTGEPGRGPGAEQVTVDLMTAGGQRVQVTYNHYPNPGAARQAYDRWYKGFDVRMFSVESNTPSRRMGKLRSGGIYHYAWQTGSWLITIAVPESVEDPAGLRDAIRDQILAAFGRLQ